MGKQGRVVSTAKDYVMVSLSRTTACEHCEACRVGFKPGDREILVRAKNLCDAQIGDFVNIEIKGRDFLLAAFIMYGIPFVMMVVGFFVGYQAGAYAGTEARELIGFFSGLFCIAVTFIVINLTDAKWRRTGFTLLATAVIAYDGENA